MSEPSRVKRPTTPVTAIAPGEPDDMLSDAALRGRALPAALYTGTGVVATGAIGILSDWLRGGAVRGLYLGLSYLACALTLGLAIVLLRRGHSLLAARVAIVTWIVTMVAVGLRADTIPAIALTPVSLAVAIGLATVFDARGVMRWTLVCAAACSAVMLARAGLYPGEMPPVQALRLLPIAPSALLVTLGLACRAAVRGRELARSAARTHSVALAERGLLLAESSALLARSGDEALAAQSAAEAATQASRAKSAFLAHMSHELRTPLNAILGYIELVRDEAEERQMPQIVADAGRMETAGRHLLQLIGNVLDLSKIEAGQMRLDPVRYDLAATLNELGATMAPAIARGHNRLVTEILLDPDPTVVGDPGYTRQIVFNLLANAAKFTEHGEISLTAHRDGDWLELSVRDTGIGMNQEQVVRVFEPFEQAETATARRHGGTGLGLTITLGLVRLMRGALTVDSSPGVGTHVQIRLPADLTRPSRSAPAPRPSEHSARFTTLRTGEITDPDLTRE